MIDLTHGLILHHTPTIANLADALVTLLALVLTLALAALSYDCFEKPIVAMGRALQYEESKKLLRAWSISQTWPTLTMVKFSRLRPLQLTTRLIAPGGKKTRG